MLKKESTYTEGCHYFAEVDENSFSAQVFSTVEYGLGYLNVDYDAYGNIVGLEFLEARTERAETDDEKEASQ